MMRNDPCPARGSLDQICGLTKVSTHPRSQGQGTITERAKASQPVEVPARSNHGAASKVECRAALSHSLSRIH